ncbi:MAG: hypothetical protein EF807_02210 [Candidatus Methanolliviera hydrocarbonicum]|uniref:Uncharacterized protein n=1 Tax=Candidatus Methanolliviera hydrocarbonicum TaxID=2491085 RepID=A0A520KY95_9EURY|nr:MAG: hypothetical protein EF807_07825 [Candidatus Methanolliviera hydrocarbonicum]RZN71685.1 MAG: hypothetical protein EF807_02210 [Candidatus Methanolliviera hydrocarbonicum]
MSKGVVKGKRDYKKEVDRKRYLKEQKKAEEKKKKEEKIVLDEKRVYIEKIYKTLFSSIFGVIGAFITFYSHISDFTSIFLILTLILIERYAVFSQITKNFSGKDWLYISFMTFLAWFIFLMVLLNL